MGQMQPTVQQQMQPTVDQQMQPTVDQQMQPTVEQQMQPTVEQQMQPIVTQQMPITAQEKHHASKTQLRVWTLDNCDGRNTVIDLEDLHLESALQHQVSTTHVKE